MTTNVKNTHLADLLQRVEAQKRRVRTIAGNLSDVQLKWAPPEGGWGVGMILEHLVMSAEAYFEILPQKISATRGKGMLAENPEWKRSFAGGFLIKSLEAPRKVKTTKSFTPQNVRANVVQRFCDAQDKMIGFMQDADGIDIVKARIKSPVLSLIRYNLADTFAIHTVHNDRHLNRAEEITKITEFPVTANV